VLAGEGGKNSALEETSQTTRETENGGMELYQSCLIGSVDSRDSYFPENVPSFKTGIIHIYPGSPGKYRIN
jgi:hypothetical protein